MHTHVTHVHIMQILCLRLICMSRQPSATQLATRNAMLNIMRLNGNLDLLNIISVQRIIKGAEAEESVLGQQYQ